MNANTATYETRFDDESQRFYVTDGDHIFFWSESRDEAQGRAEELEAELDAESERFGDHGVFDPWDEGRGDYDGDHATGLASVYGEDW